MSIVVLVAISLVSSIGERPAASQTGPTLVSYDPAVGVTQMQTVGVLATGAAPGGDGTFTLALGGVPTAPIPFDATLQEFVDAVESAGVPVATASGGGDGQDPPRGRFRYTITFATDPGELLTVVDNQTWRPDLGGMPGEILISCVHCLEIRPPTGPSNGGVVILLHGGGLVTGTRDDVALGQYGERFRAAGWTTATASYRLSQVPRDFGACDIDQATLGTDPCSPWIQAADDAGADVQMAVRHLTDHAAAYGIDPGRIVTVGRSAGGIAALTALYRSPDPGGRRPAAAASVAGLVRDQLVTPGAPPAFFAAATHDPAYQPLGMDTFEEGRELLSKARQVGATVEVRAYLGMGHSPEPTLGTYLGARDTRPEAEDLLGSMLGFFDAQVLRPAARPGPQWFGQPAPALTSRPPGGQTVFTRTTETRRVIPADVNGDGRTDLLWYGVGAAVDTLWIARADGTFFDPIEANAVETALGYVPFIDQPGSYSTTVVGDFDGNGREDVLWWSGTSPLQIWRFGLRADGRPTVSLPGGILPPLAVPLVGDFDGDRRADVLWWGPGLTPDSVWYGNANGTFTAGGAVTDPGSSLLQPALGDFEGDGRTDIFWRDPFGTNRLWFGADRGARFAIAPTHLVPSTTGTGDKVAVGDIDGDRRSDLIVHGIGNRPDGVWRLLTDPTTGASSWTVTPFTLGGAPDLRIADLDGDGRADVLASVPGASTMTVLRGATSGSPTVSILRIDRAGTALVGRFDGLAGSSSFARSDVYWP